VHREVLNGPRCYQSVTMMSLCKKETSAIETRLMNNYAYVGGLHSLIRVMCKIPG
jgi:hypothetical protein